MFSWLFGKKTDSVPVLAKKIARAARIYYRGNDGILIGAEHSDVAGFSGPGKPMTRLPINAPDIELGEWCKQCLQASAETSKLQQAQFEAAIAPFFQLARVKGWAQLEKQWDYVRIYEDPSDNVIHVVPHERVRGGGYDESNDENRCRCELDAEQIGRCLRNLIDSNL